MIPPVQMRTAALSHGQDGCLRGVCWVAGIAFTRRCLDGGDGCRFRAEGGDALPNLALQLLPDVRVLAQEILRVLAPLAESRRAVVEPGATLFDESHLETDVDQTAFTGDAGVVHMIEFDLTKRRSNLVLHDLHANSVPDHVASLLDGIDASNVKAYGGVKLQRPAARSGFGIPEHDANLLTKLVDEDDRRFRAV